MTSGTFFPTLWLLLCCVAASRQSSLSITALEVPQAVHNGENVELKCRYELGSEIEKGLYVKWWMITLHDDNRTQLYQRIGNNSVAIQHNVALKDNELDTIVLSNVTPADSGTYECEVANIAEDRKHQQMIVFTQGTGPQLNVTTVPDGSDEDEKEDVLIECDASGVAPMPDFAVTVNGQELNFTEVITGPDEKGFYEIYGSMTVSMEEADGADIRCELVYVNPNITHQPYFAAELYSGSGFTTEVPEDTTEMDTTPNPLQANRGCYQQASWFLFAVPVIIRLTSLI